METITILLSTYNGASFINKQLESIYRQIGLENYSLKILCRDDGSTDNTIDILNSWKGKLSIEVIEGENVGARDSFFKLLNIAPDSDYYAFCDQDDIWYEEKLSSSIKQMTVPRTLFFSNIEYIDSKGEKLGRNLLSDSFECSLARTLMCNPANGCSMVWDKSLHSIFRTVPNDTFTMHDEYVCTVALLFGNVIYDQKATMGYRLHDLNVTQSKSIAKKIKLWKSVWLERKPYSLDKRADVLLKYELKESDRKLLYRLSQYKKGLNRFIVQKSFSCENRRIERSFRLRMLIGVL